MLHPHFTFSGPGATLELLKHAREPETAPLLCQLPRCPALMVPCCQVCTRRHQALGCSASIGQHCIVQC